MGRVGRKKSTPHVQNGSSSLITDHRLLCLRGQSVVEYSVLFGTVCAVMIGMQVYTKRAVQGRLKQGVDMIAERAGSLARGEQGRPEHQQQLEAEPGEVGAQFSPTLSNFTVTGTSHQRSRASLSTSGERASTLLDHATTQFSGGPDDFSNKKLTEEPLFE